jgi:proteasome lid subunit RPN8/RPN11
MTKVPIAGCTNAQVLEFSRTLYDRLVAVAMDRHPVKSFGYLVSDGPAHRPADFVLFEENVRNDALWQPEFWDRGRYFVDNHDAGFVATAEESWRVQKSLMARGLFEVGVFHTHQRHPANFSSIDFEMHVSRFDSLWHLVISLRNVGLPQVRAFEVSPHSVREMELCFVPDNGPARHEDSSGARRG